MKKLKEKPRYEKTFLEFIEHHPDVMPSLKAAYDRYEKSIEQGLIDLKRKEYKNGK